HLQPHKHAIFPILRQIAELDNVRTYCRLHAGVDHGRAAALPGVDAGEFGVRHTATSSRAGRLKDGCSEHRTWVPLRTSLRSDRLMDGGSATYQRFPDAGSFSLQTR